MFQRFRLNQLAVRGNNNNAHAKQRPKVEKHTIPLQNGHHQKSQRDFERIMQERNEALNSLYEATYSMKNNRDLIETVQRYEKMSNFIDPWGTPPTPVESNNDWQTRSYGEYDYYGDKRSDIHLNTRKKKSTNFISKYWW